LVHFDLGAALRLARSSDPASITDVVGRIAGELGASDTVVYLVDFAQDTLEPLPDRRQHADRPTSEDVPASIAGRAFADGHTVVSDRADGVRVWVPIIEGSDRTGVLALTMPDAQEATLAACEELALLTGYLISSHARSTDHYNLFRRRRALSLAASMQWDLLPPLVLKTARASVAGLLEPAYEVGGDCFDYALNDDELAVAIFDAMGHGVGSSLIAALAVGCYRHDRREGSPLDVTHTHLDAALATHLPSFAFSTGQLARLDLDDGTFTWTNAGHPLPLLLRGGRVIRTLECRPTVPWGLGALASTTIQIATEALEPGDSVLFYTDGVIEAHVPGGEGFGAERLADLLGQVASDLLEPEEIVRKLSQSVLEHQDQRLADDATFVLVQWHGSDPGRYGRSRP
jgi:serine phosphatase RsbU (regulator of sigma subunit)